MDPIEATMELREARAVSHGIALALNGEDQKVQSHTKNVIRRAFPERFD